MSSNQRRNEAALKKYRKDLEAMLGDIREVDKRVLNKGVNAGLVEAKRLTAVDTGFMRKSWGTSPVKNIGNRVEKSLFNTAEYSRYVNYGHRIVRNAKTYGFVKGTFVLERAINKVETVMVNEFKKAIEEVNRKYGK